ncbi:expressed unknown protein [Seminavis robusta]|uniref:Uncharacterized protein n=1 Tax=Seminavis robusta TaxID=568900 RepID=A0A9N8D5E6_9STRA|nr:expressed unknown protein [Seminavis robusta]|eukprot:Sro5_g003940.1 n/a (241) ;mRNA; r:7833-8555
MMNSVAEMIKKHNMDAISLLRSGEIAESIQTFKSALRAIQSGLPNEPDYAAFVEHERAVLPPSSLPPVRTVSIVDNEEALANLLADSPALLDFYPRVFQMLSPSCVASHTRSIVVLLYNMAVALDYQGILVDDASAALTFQASARQLYDSALQFASTHWDKEDMTAMRGVILAVVNNLGRLQSLRLAFQETRFCVKLAMELMRSWDAMNHIDNEDVVKLGMSVGPFYLLNKDILTVAPSA